MKRVSVVAAGVLVAGMCTVPAVAQTSENSIQQCPEMHVIVVHDAYDSTALSDQDQGFLGSIVAPVVESANPGVKDYSAGFSATPTQVDQPTTSKVSPASEKAPDVWGSVPSTKAAGVPDVWGTPAPEASSSATTTSAASSSVVASSVVATTGQQKNKTAQVGRTYVNVEGFRTGAFIPGVHSETDASWRDHIAAGIKKTSAVVEGIHRQCPETKLVLMGNNQGAAVVSEVARSIGHGEGPVPAAVVAGVSTFADPTRAENQPTAVGENQKKLQAKTVQGIGLTTVSEGLSPRGFGSLEQKTVSWCLEGDTRCGVKKAAPVVRLAQITNSEVNFAHDPEGSLRYLADILAPSVALAGVETMAEDISFSNGGFRFTRATSADSTLVGRIAVNAETEVSQTDVERRLVAAGQKLGGMALAAGVTVAKKVITPANIAQIAAASAAGPEAALAVAGVKVIEAAASLFTAETATTGAVRLLDEAKAGGMEVPEIAEAAVTTVVGQTINQTAYKNQPATDTGQSAASATTMWLAGLAATELGNQAPAGLVEKSKASQKVTGVKFDQAAVDAAVAGLRKDQRQ